MNPVEDALIRRLDARRLIADRLNQRERRIFCRYYRYGETYKEIGNQLGLTGARIMQLHDRAEKRLLGRLAVPPPIPPHIEATRPGFDKAAFLEHIRRLIARREVDRAEAKERGWQREMAVMSHFVALATPKPPPTRPPPPPPPPPRPQPQWQPPPSQNVEPWFDLSRQPTLGDMRCIAQYAHGYFTAARRLVQSGMGSTELGKQMAHAICPRDADAISGALHRWSKEIPPAARFSASPLPVPHGVLGATVVSPYLAIQVASVEDGQKVSIAVTYD